MANRARKPVAVVKLQGRATCRPVPEGRWRRFRSREKEIGQHIGYRYDVNLVPDYKRLTPFLKQYMETMGWDDLNWLEDVHMGYEEGRPPSSTATSTAGCTVPSGISSFRTTSRTAT
jgi:hypothetical protein